MNFRPPISCDPFFFSKLQVNTISEYTIHKRNNIDKNLSVVDIYYRLFRIQCMDFFFFAFVVMLFYKLILILFCHIYFLSHASVTLDLKASYMLLVKAWS